MEIPGCFHDPGKAKFIFSILDTWSGFLSFRDMAEPSLKGDTDKSNQLGGCSNQASEPLN